MYLLFFLGGSDALVAAALDGVRAEAEWEALGRLVDFRGRPAPDRTGVAVIGAMVSVNCLNRDVLVGELSRW